VLSRSSFVLTDAQLLGEHYDVQLVDCRTVLGVIRTVVAAIRGDCVFCWFGSVWFLPALVVARLLRKPVVIVCGGYDVANLPAIGYGNMRNPVSRLSGKLVFRLASLVLPFSQSAHREARENADIKPEKLRMIYLGVDDATGAGSVELRKKPVVLTVSNVDESTLTRKGLLVVAELSRLLPEVEFLIVGPTKPEALKRLQNASGSNVRFTGFVSHDALERLMSTSKVIFQPSLHEGFGMSVAEAMLHGAIPVVSPRFSLPELVGDVGLYGDPSDPTTFLEPLRRALAGNREAAEAARARIVRDFSLARRRRELLAVVDSVCHCSSDGRPHTGELGRITVHRAKEKVPLPSKRSQGCSDRDIGERETDDHAK
jgi:glycosyltransferase involved in cell wall biosynthesis